MLLSSTEQQGKSKEELCDILRRQEKLLSNKRFLQSLPDKGKKIADSVERLRLAVAKHDEEDKKKNALLAVRAEFQSQYQRALTQRQSGSRNHVPSRVFSEISHTPAEAVNTTSEVVPGLEASCAGRLDSISADELDCTPNGTATAALDIDTSSDSRTLTGSGEAKEKDLAEALERVTLSDDSAGSSLSENARSNDEIVDNPFWGRQPRRKPHCIEILDKTETNCLTRKPKFRPNQLIQKIGNSSTGSGSPDRSPGGTISHPALSVEARRQQDRKHLDEITAARLPPLHHNPTMLLTLEESASLQYEHVRKYTELQTKIAAQRIAERLGVSMESYNPEGEMQGRYREVIEDPSEQSSEED